MGRFSDLERQAHDAEQRVVERQERVKLRVSLLRDRFREHYLAGTIVVAGAAVGILLHQYIRIRAAASGRHRVRAQAAPRASATRAGRRSTSLMPIVQFVLATVFAQSKRKRRRAATPPPEAIAPLPDRQSSRSMSLADHSTPRSGNGLLRH